MSAFVKRADGFPTVDDALTEARDGVWISASGDDDAGWRWAKQQMVTQAALRQAYDPQMILDLARRDIAVALAALHVTVLAWEWGWFNWPVVGPLSTETP